MGLNQSKNQLENTECFKTGFKADSQNKGNKAKAYSRKSDEFSSVTNHQTKTNMLKIIFLLGVLIMATRAEDKDCQWNEWLCEGECIDREQSCNGVCKENMVLCPQSNQNETSCIFQHEACNGSCLSPEASVYLPYSDRCVSECSGK